MQDITYRLHGVSAGEIDHLSVKRYTIPRKTRRISEDCQSQISLNSREAKEIETNIKRLMWKASELENVFSIDQIYKVDNPALERKFQEKRSELREDGRSQRELTEHLAFLIETTHHKVKDICVDGLKCNGDDSLGDGQMGVSLWKIPDLLLRNLECPESGIVYLVVFRIVKGRVKQVATKPYPQAPNLEPTPNYDCHMSRTAPSPSMNDHQTLLKSTQYYLYEYDDEGLPCERPRLCLPSAVVHLRKKNAKGVTEEHAQSRESNSSPSPHVTENTAIPFLTESCGSVAWRGLITNNEKGLGWVTMMVGHKLGLNLWKSYLDVTKMVSLVELEKIIPGDVRSAWRAPLCYRGCVFSLCMLKATSPYTESFVRFTKKMSEKAKSAGVICVDATTTIFLLPSSGLTVRLGIFQNGEPWRMCCIVCRHKGAVGKTGSMTACRSAPLLLPTDTVKDTTPTSQFVGHVFYTTVQHRDHFQLPQSAEGLTKQPKSVVKRSHSDSDCWYPISNCSPEYHSSYSKTKQRIADSDMTELQGPHLDAKPQDENNADKSDIDVPENNHSSNSEVFGNLNSKTKVNTVAQLKLKKKRSCSADLSPQSAKKYIRHAKTLRKCHSKKSSGVKSKEECPPEKCDTLPTHPAQNQQTGSSHSYDTTNFGLTTLSNLKGNNEVIYVDSSSEVEDTPQSSLAPNSSLPKQGDFKTANLQYKFGENTCKEDVSESKTYTATADNELGLSDNYRENSESTENLLQTNTTASQGITLVITRSTTVLSGPSELPPHRYEKLDLQGKLHRSEQKKSCLQSPNRQSLWDSVSDLGSNKSSAATSEEEVEEETSRTSNSAIAFSKVTTKTESETSNLRKQTLDSSVLQKSNKNDCVSSYCKMPVVVERKDCLEHNGDTLASLESESSCFMPQSHDTTSTNCDIPGMIENESTTVKSTKFPLSPVFERKPCHILSKENSERSIHHCNTEVISDSTQVPNQSVSIGDGMSPISTAATVSTYKHNEVPTTEASFRSSDDNVPRKSNTIHSTPGTSYYDSPITRGSKGANSVDPPKCFGCNKSNQDINDGCSSLLKSKTATNGSLNSKLSKPDTPRESYARAFQRVFVSLKSPRKRRHSDTELTQTTMKESNNSSPVSSPVVTSSDLTPKSLEIYERHKKKLKLANFAVKSSKTSISHLFSDGDTKDEEGTTSEDYSMSNESEVIQMDTETDTAGSTLYNEQCCEEDAVLAASAALSDVSVPCQTPGSEMRHDFEDLPSTKSVTTNSISQLETRVDDNEDDLSDTELENFFRVHKANTVGGRLKADKELNCELVKTSKALYSEILISEQSSMKEPPKIPCFTSSPECKKSPCVSESTSTPIQDITVETVQENPHRARKTVPKTLSHQVEGKKDNISPRTSFECTTDTKCLESKLDIPCLKTSTAEENVSSLTKKFEHKAFLETAESGCVVSGTSTDYPCMSDNIGATTDQNVSLRSSTAQENVSSLTKKFDDKAFLETAESGCVVSGTSTDYPCMSDNTEASEDQDVSDKISTSRGDDFNTGTTARLECNTSKEVLFQETTLPKFSVAQCTNPFTTSSESMEAEQELKQKALVPNRTAIELEDQLVEASCTSSDLDTGISEQKNSTPRQPLVPVVSASVATGSNTIATDSKPSNIEQTTTITTTNHTCRENTAQSEEVLVPITSVQSCIKHVQGCDIQVHKITDKTNKLTEKMEELKEEPNQGQKENENHLNLNDAPLAENQNIKRSKEESHSKSVSIPHNTKRQQKEDFQVSASGPHRVTSNGQVNVDTRGPLKPSWSPADPLPHRWSPPVNYPCNYPSTAEHRGGYASDRFMFVPTLRPAARASFGWGMYRAPPVWNTDRRFCFGNFGRQVRPNTTSVSWSVRRFPLPMQTFSFRNNANFKINQRRN